MTFYDDAVQFFRPMFKNQHRKTFKNQHENEQVAAKFLKEAVIECLHSTSIKFDDVKTANFGRDKT